MATAGEPLDSSRSYRNASSAHIPEHDSVTLEFDARMTSPEHASQIRNILKQMSGIDRFIVEQNKQSVLVVTKKHSSDIQQAIEQTGVAAVLKGMGAGGETGAEHQGAAVSIVTQNGDELDKTSVIGVARFLQNSSSGNCVIDATIDGLPPRQKVYLGIGQFGDISGGCASCGPLAVDVIGDDAVLGYAETNDNGRLALRTTKDALKISDIIGRSLVLYDGSSDRTTRKEVRPLKGEIGGEPTKRFGCGIVARSAGLFQNTKRVCSCSGKSLWEERNEAKASISRT